METLREERDVFDAVLDTVGGKEVREAAVDVEWICRFSPPAASNGDADQKRLVTSLTRGAEWQCAGDVTRPGVKVLLCIPSCQLIAIFNTSFHLRAEFFWIFLGFVSKFEGTVFPPTRVPVQHRNL